MKFTRFSGALALAVLFVPALAQADDPNDPTMRSPAARARDAAMIRQLNRDELARVQKRDANYAQGWRAYRDSGASGSDAREYANARADYQRQMADWRYAVAACRDGRVEYCR